MSNNENNDQMRKFIFFLISMPLCFVAATSFAESPLPGPYPATVISVTDGDSVKVKVQIWLGLYQEVAVRIKGIDTPEISKPNCPKEMELGKEAKKFLESILPKGQTVSLKDISGDKYGGRVVASLLTTDGKDLGQLLLKRGMAFSYNGGKKRSWCNLDN
jgi:endonuclease YncB( thermonuclease family)